MSEASTAQVIINIGIVLFCVVPSLFALREFKKAKPKYYGLLFVGVGLILWAAFSLYFLQALKPDPRMVEAFGMDGKKFMDELRPISNTLSVWIYVFPAVNAAIGANLVTAFLLAEKTNKDNKQENST